MQTYTVVDSKIQTQAPQVWDKPTAQANIGDRFYIPCTPIAQVVDKDILADRRVWLLVKPVSGSYTEEWIVQPEPAVEPQQQPQLGKTELQQPVGFAGDTGSAKLQPNWEAQREYESGMAHGKLDSAHGSQMICQKASCPYSCGYLDGYSSYLNSHLQSELPQIPTWKASWNSKWGWYDVWVGDHCLREKASSDQEGERIAQKYIAAEELRQQHRELVLAAYAG